MVLGMYVEQGLPKARNPDELLRELSSRTWLPRLSNLKQKCIEQHNAIALCVRIRKGSSKRGHKLVRVIPRM